MAKERLTTEVIKNEMLLRTDVKGWNAWHIAAYWGKLDLMKGLWELAKERLPTEEIKNEMLLRTDGLGRSAWNIEAFRDNAEAMREI